MTESKKAVPSLAPQHSPPKCEYEYEYEYAIQSTHLLNKVMYTRNNSSTMKPSCKAILFNIEFMFG